MEFFYGHPGGVASTRFEHAIEKFQGAKIAVNAKRGSLKDNLDLTRRQGITDWREWWMRTLALDAVIGNTDRHAENWGFLIDQNDRGALVTRMAPAFDNGTSLGWGIEDQDIPSFLLGAKLGSYAKHGKHHFGWLPGDSAASAGHVSLCKKFLDTYGSGRSVRDSAKNVIDAFSDGQIAQVVGWCASFAYSAPFGAARSDLVERLLKEKRNALLRAIGDLL